MTDKLKPQKLTNDILEQISKNHEILVPHFIIGEPALIFEIKAINLRKLIVDYASSNERSKKKAYEYILKVSNKDGKVKDDNLSEFLEKADSLIVDVLKRGMQNPTYDDIVSRGLELDIYQKSIIFYEIFHVSGSDSIPELRDAEIGKVIELLREESGKM